MIRSSFNNLKLVINFFCWRKYSYLSESQCFQDLFKISIPSSMSVWIALPCHVTILVVTWQQFIPLLMKGPRRSWELHRANTNKVVQCQPTCWHTLNCCIVESVTRCTCQWLCHIHIAVSTCPPVVIMVISALRHHCYTGVIYECDQ